MNKLEKDLVEIRSRISTSNLIWNSEDSDFQREEIGNIVSEVTGFNLSHGTKYKDIVDNLCAEYIDNTIEEEFDSLDDRQGISLECFDDIDEYLESQEEVTIEMIKIAIEKFTDVSEFDDNPTEFNELLYTLAEQYEIEDQLEF